MIFFGTNHEILLGKKTKDEKVYWSTPTNPEFFAP